MLFIILKKINMAVNFDVCIIYYDVSINYLTLTKKLYLRERFTNHFFISLIQRHGEQMIYYLQHFVITFLVPPYLMHTGGNYSL